jgi:Bacterial Ig-like domain (group 3)
MYNVLKRRAFLCLLSTFAALFVFAGTLAFAAVQATFYVSPSGDDSNAGTLASPLLTIAGAQAQVRAINQSMTGDIMVYLRGGTYTISSPIVFTPADSGTNGFHVIYQAYNNEVPVISGGVQVSGWTLDHGSVYKASLSRSTKLRNLFVNGVRASITLSPTPITGQGFAGTFTVAGTEPWVAPTPAGQAPASGPTPDDVQFNSSNVEIYDNPGDVELMQNLAFNSIIVSVRGICTKGQTGCNETGSYTDFQLQQPYGALATSLRYGTNMLTNGQFYVRNAYELLNTPGQFYFNRTTQTLYYDSRGENMSTATVMAPLSEGLLQVYGTSATQRVTNLEFIGITFAFDHWQMYSVGGSNGMAALQSVAGQVLFSGAYGISGGVQNTTYTGWGWHNDAYNDTQTAQASIDVRNASGVVFQGDQFEHLSSGIALSLTNDVVNSSATGNAFVDLSGNSVNVGNAQNAYANATNIYSVSSLLFPAGAWGVCTGDTIQNNLIRLPNREYYQFEGLSAAYVNGLQLLHNDASQMGYTGISLGWGWVNTPDSTTSQNNTVSYNRFVNMNQVLSGDGGALYTLGQMPNTTVSSNYVDDALDGVYPDQGSSHISFTDNVLQAMAGDWLYIWSASAMPDITVSDSYTDSTNLLNAGGAANNDIVTGTTYATPLTSNPAAVSIMNASGLTSSYQYLLNAAVVSSLTATVVNSQVALSWQSTGAVISFNVYRGTTSNGEGSTPYISGAPSSIFTDTSVIPGTTYYYKITAVGPSGTESPTSSEVSVTVNGATSGLATTSTGLTISTNPITTAQTVMLTAAVTSATAGTPTGTVQFYDGTTALGAAVPLASAQATSPAISFNAGTHPITAVYSGDTTFGTSTSSPVSLVVNALQPPSFTFTAPSSTVTVSDAASTGATDVLTVAPAGGYAGTVLITCAVTGNGTPLPTCAALPTSVAVTASGSATSTLTFAPGTAVCPAATSSPSSAPSITARLGGLGGVAFAGLLLLLLPGRRRRSLWASLSLLALFAALTTTLTSCSGSPQNTSNCNTATSPGTYTVTVNGKDSAGTPTAQTTITVNVTQ